MPDPTPTPTEQVDNALTLAKDAQAILDRAKELGAALPPEFEEQANALITLDSPKTTNIAKALQLEESAGEAQILKAIADLRTPPDLKTLEAVAGTHGMLFLSAERVTELEAAAARGTKATEDLHTQRFAIAYEKAQFEGRVDARPETRELHRQIFEANPELAIKNLASMPQVVNVISRNDLKVIENASEPDAPDGYEPESFQLDKRAKAYIAEHPDVDYLTAVEAVS